MKKRAVKILGSIFAIFLIVLLVGPFLIPVPPLENTVSAESLAEADSKFIEVNGIRVHYKQLGEAKRPSSFCMDLAQACFPGEKLWNLSHNLGRSLPTTARHLV
ncbi:MAG: hypothetical protein U0X74_04475 [Anaerolineales bacterium]